jgi:DNA polymerase V
MDQEFALEDLEESLLWGVLLFSVRWHHVKARTSFVR